MWADRMDDDVFSTTMSAPIVYSSGDELIAGAITKGSVSDSETKRSSGQGSWVCVWLVGGALGI